jgi:thiamine biosynthesis lipoprotein
VREAPGQYRGLLLHPAKPVRGEDALKLSSTTAVICLALLLAALSSTAFADGSREPLVERTRFMMGTYVTVFVGGPDEQAKAAAAAALDRMEEVDDRFHALNPDSPVYAFNNFDTPVTDTEILGVVKAALEISRKTDGAFDVTVAPLVDLWGFFGDSPGLPEPDEIREALSLVGHDRIALENGALIKVAEGTRIDLGAIAKGHAVAEGLEVLVQHGIESALIDAGGDIYSLGRRGDALWKVGIRSPRDEELLGYIEVEDLAVMGSGDYERFFMKDGVRYHHIIDPETGYPARGLTGITVACPDPMLADAWATALFVLGPERGLEIVESEPDLETIMVTPSGEVLASSGFSAELKGMPPDGQ